MNGPHPLTIENHPSKLAMLVHSKTDAHVSKHIAEQGVWENFETQLLMQSLCAGATFVDVGANIGYYSIVASPLVGSTGRVFAFEPERDNFSLLEKNIQHNQLTNITAVAAALSYADSDAELFLNEENRGDHQIFQQSLGESTPQRTRQAIRLLNGADYFLSAGDSQPVDRIDVLKVDTQGAEFSVMSGLLPLIKKSLPSIKIILEFTPYSLRQAGSSGMALLDLVDELALPMNLIDHLGHKLIPINYDEMKEWILQTDADEGNEGFINLLLGE
jgi:FkbM family methyltransferase